MAVLLDKDAGATREILPLTSIRFFAAIWVVFFHTLRPFLPAADNLLIVRNIANCGWLGVDLFFVLSGYILGKVYLQPGTQVERAKFYAVRFARIYPLYIFSLLVALPFLAAWTFAKLPPARAWVLFSTKSLYHIFLLQGWYVATAANWNPPSWSLSVEAFFYYLFPWLGPRLWRMRSPWILIASAWLVGLLVEATYQLACADGLVSEATGSVLHTLPVLHLAKFLTGLAVARVSLSAATASKMTAITLVVTALIAAFCPFPLLLRNIWPLFALLIVGLAHGRGFIEWFLSREWMVFLGQASFAVYLLHWPLWSAFFSTKDKTLLEPALGSIWNAPGYITYLLVLVASSAACYRWIEVPARKILRLKLIGNTI
jgi:peptidoglycan/LPS O-acetylase OafA/YrhL